MSNLKIALTGGIACGKSSVGELLHKMGAVFISLDVLSRQVVRPNTPALTALVLAFGDAILNANKTLNRAKLRQYLLASADNQRLIENILHPLILTKMAMEIAPHKNALIIVEIPRISPENSHHFDGAIIVECSQQQQLKRLMQRENIGKKEAEKRIIAQANQNNIPQKMPTNVLENNANIEDLTQKTRDLYAKLINL